MNIFSPHHNFFLQNSFFSQMKDYFMDDAILVVIYISWMMPFWLLFTGESMVSLAVMSPTVYFTDI